MGGRPQGAVTVDVIDRILRESRTVAVVGMSPNPHRPSHYVARYLMEHGYRVIPVNPVVQEVMGLKSYPDLLSVPTPVDLVDVFRRSEYVAPVVEQAIEIGARFLWLQDGVVDHEAARRAREAGLLVVMDN